MHLIFLRNPETEQEVKGVLPGQGILDSGWFGDKLSAKGQEQLKKTAKQFKDRPIDGIHTSDLGPCYDLAKEIYADHKDATFVKEKALRERCWADLEGKVLAKTDWTQMNDGDYFYRTPPGKNGEAFIDVWERVGEFYMDLLGKHTDETILIVTHSGPLLVLQGLIHFHDFEKSNFRPRCDRSYAHMQYSVRYPKLDNASITEFVITQDGEYTDRIKNEAGQYIKLPFNYTKHVA